MHNNHPARRETLMLFALLLAMTLVTFGLVEAEALKLAHQIGTQLNQIGPALQQ